MKKLWMILVAGLLVAAFTAPALAWEFALTGEAEWRYRYFARQGDADLFGTGMFNNGGGGVLLQPALGLAGPVNNAVRVQGFSAKGADAATQDQRFWFYPEIRINPAVRIRGEYWVTGTNLNSLYDGTGINTSVNPADNWYTNRGYTGWYFNSAQAAAPAGMSVGLWEKMWVTAQTPWGILAFGRRPFAFGLGWSTLHEKDMDTDSIVIVAPYGPMTFIIGPSSSYGTPGDGIVPNSTPIVGVVNAAPGFAQGLNNLNRAKGTDKTGRSRSWHMAAAFTYRNGPVDLGTFFTFTQFNNAHAFAQPVGPGQADDNNATTAATLAGTYGDPNSILFVNYFKYNNGRFFFNAEYDFFYGDIVRKGGRPVDLRSDAWMVELGALCGPSKVTLASFYSSGHDRRGGVLNPANPVGTFGAAQVYDHVSQYAIVGGRVEAIKPYVWLMGIYGGGNDSFDVRGYPTYADWFSYNARLDYAVAANLNVWGAYTYAMRASNTGTRIAQFDGTPAAGFGNAASPALLPVPNVPDNYLGWEANVGVDWKLLEGLTFKGQFAYWQPGDWFKWAYVDHSAVAPIFIGGTQTALWVNPNRGIDPLIGFQGSLLVEF